jgi:hypothetical protein
VVREIQFDDSRALALSGLAPYLTASLWPEALAVAREIRSASARASALSGLLLQIDWRSINLDFWCETLNTLSQLDRTSFIQEMPQLVQGILAFGDNAALASVVVAMREICEQWR